MLCRGRLLSCGTERAIQGESVKGGGGSIGYVSTSCLVKSSQRLALDCLTAMAVTSCI